MSKRFAVAALAWVALGAGRAEAQEASRRTVGFLVNHSVTAGASAHQRLCLCPTSDVLAPVAVSTVEVDVAWALAKGTWWSLEYPLRVVPFALVRNNPTDAAQPNPLGVGWTISPSPGRASTVGLGVKPLGLRGWAGSDRLAVVVDVGSGFLRFGSPLLAANGLRFNFVVDAGAGIRVGVPGRGHTVIGYRWHHLSNAGLGEVNPGLNSGMLYLGFWLR